MDISYDQFLIEYEPASGWYSDSASRAAYARATSKITQDDHGEWTCVCGNVTASDGFYPSDAHGQEVEPVEGVWNGKTYVCARCRHVFDQTLVKGL